MNKEEIEKLLQPGGELDTELWQLGFWLSAHNVGYMFPEERLNRIVASWEANGLNKEAIIKLRRWQELKKIERGLKAQLEYRT